MGLKSATQGLSTPMFVGIVVLIGIILISVAVMVGKSDDGQINVSDTIENSNRENIEQGGDPADSIGTTPKNLRDLPNGGLVPQNTQDNVLVPKPESEPVTEKDEVGTTTDDAIEIENEDDVSDTEGEPAA